MKTLGLGLLLVVAVGGGYLLFRADAGGEPVAPVSGGSPETPPEQAPPPEARVVEAFAPVKLEEVPKEDRVLLPDGTWAKALNGTKNPPAMDWPREIPWSAIKEVVVDPSGQQWYRHEDGSMSTTLMTYRSDLGRMDAVTQIANPTESVARDDVPGPRLPDAGTKKN